MRIILLLVIYILFPLFIYNNNRMFIEISPIYLNYLKVDDINKIRFKIYL